MKTKLRIKVPNFSIDFKRVSRMLFVLSNSSSAIIIAVAVFLLGMNVFSQYYFVRIDLTDNQAFSLTSSTRSIIRELPEKVTITTYFSDNLPPELNPTVRDVNDILKEYERYSGGKLTINEANSDSDTFRTDALSKGIQEVQFSELDEDGFAVATGFIGIELSQEDGSKSIPIITSVNNLEYEITSRILDLSDSNKAKIAFLTGHGEKSLEGDYREVATLMSAQYDIDSIELSDLNVLNGNIYKLIIIAGATEEFPDGDLYKLDQYLLSGGKLVVLSDQYVVNTQSASLAPNATNLDDFISHYGATLDEQVVLDYSFLQLGSGVGYPFWVLAQGDNIDQTYPPLVDIESAAFFWTGSISSTSDDNEFIPLVKTTDRAWSLSGDSISVDPNSIIANPTDESQYTITALLSGAQSSYFVEREKPSDVDVEQFIESSEDAQILLFADSDFLTDNYIMGSEQNSTLFVNLVDNLASIESLAEIRSKNIESRPLDTLENREKNIVKFANTVLIPSVLAVVGISYNLYRKKRKSLI